MKTGIELIAEERQRQLDSGWTADHDHQHDGGYLALVAASLGLPEGYVIVKPSGPGNARVYGQEFEEPWGLKAKHAHDRTAQCRISGALYAAEIDRLNRLTEKD